LLPVVLVVTAFIVYGSLYPWQFHAATIPGNPFLILLSSWSIHLNRYFVKDTVINLVLYMPFGASCYLWLAGRALWMRTALPLLLALCLSSSIEMIQLFDAQRFCSLVDVATNLTGTAIGIALATRFQARVALQPGTAAPLFLLSCWVGALLFPFMPDFSTHHLLYKLSTFAAPHLTIVPFFNALVMWLAAANLLEASVKRRAVPILLLVLPARLFVSGITLSWTDCLPAVLALLIWFLLPPRRNALLAALSSAAILLTGLAPFHFSATAQSFSWVPFRALFTTDWEFGFSVFFRKCFAYGSTVWFLAAAGPALPRAAASVAVMLAGLEAVQLWLPNHVAESTDPLHALLLAWILSRLQSRNSTVGKRVC
jgi:hypothetical protein